MLSLRKEMISAYNLIAGRCAGQVYAIIRSAIINPTTINRPNTALMVVFQEAISSVARAIEEELGYVENTQPQTIRIWR